MPTSKCRLVDMDVHELEDRRIDYVAPGLEDGMFTDPFEMFGAWLAEAVRAQDDGHLFEATAMNIATARPAPDGQWQPRIRTVLLKAWDRRGFCFFTNQESDKGREISENPRVGLHIHWPELYRQVRIEGVSEELPRLDAEEYFATRPRGAQINAWASRQSRPIGSRTELGERHDEIEERFRGGEVPCPPHWGGYRVRPEAFEFWQGQPSRLHDRIRFTPGREGWDATRLCP